MKILIIPGLTLPDVSDEDLARIKGVAGNNAQVIVSTQKEAIEHAVDAEVIFGFVPKTLFDAAPNLRWVHAIASGVDAFLYPEFIESDVLLTSEVVDRIQTLKNDAEHDDRPVNRGNQDSIELIKSVHGIKGQTEFWLGLHFRRKRTLAR